MGKAGWGVPRLCCGGGRGSDRQHAGGGGVGNSWSAVGHGCGRLLELTETEGSGEKWLCWWVNDRVSWCWCRVHPSDRLLAIHHHHHLPVLANNLLQHLVLLGVEDAGIQVLLELLQQQGVLLSCRDAVGRDERIKPTSGYSWITGN